MTDPIPRQPPTRHGLWLAAGPSFVASAGVVANIVQVVSLGTITTSGLVASGCVVATTVALVGYNVRRRKRADDAPADELNEVRSTLASTFAAHRPYQDSVAVVFEIGRHPLGDVVVEHHVTTAVPTGTSVYWCYLEPFSRGPDQILEWNALGLLVDRWTSGQAQQAVPIRLPGTSAPTSLIFFTPPSPTVEWHAKYFSPSFWDPLRQGGSQQFAWVPPAAGLDEPARERSSVQSVTFEFRVAQELGRLDEPGLLPDGVTFEKLSNDAHHYAIKNVAALRGGTNSAVNAIQWPLTLRRRGGKT